AGSRTHRPFVPFAWTAANASRDDRPHRRHRIQCSCFRDQLPEAYEFRTSVPLRHISAVNVFDVAILLFNSKRAQRIQATSDPGDLANAIVDLDLTAICETRKADPLIDDSARAFSFKIQVN